MSKESAIELLATLDATERCDYLKEKHSSERAAGLEV